MTTRTKPMKNQDWSQEEIDLLKGAAKEHTLSEIASQMLTLSQVQPQVQARNEKSIRYKLYKIAFHEMQDGVDPSHVYANYIRDPADYQAWEKSHLERINVSKNRESRPVESTEDLLVRLDRCMKSLAGIVRTLNDRLKPQ